MGRKLLPLSTFLFAVSVPLATNAQPAVSATTTLAESLSSVVGVPDAGLRERIERILGLASGAPITQGDLARLRELEAEGWEIADLAGLEFAMNVERLYLRNNKIEDMSPLAHLTSLTTLDLSGNEIADVSPLAHLTSLTTLDLSGNEIADVSPLAGVTLLTELDLWDNAISDVSPLAGLTALTTLGLSVNNVMDVSPLAGLTSLTSLGLDGNKIVDLSPLAGLKSLTSLSLSSNNITDVSPLADLTWLRALYLFRNKITDVSPLADLNSLTHLDLSGTQVSDPSLLAGLTSLTSLGLGENNITDVSPLADLNSLISLSLYDNKITDVSPLAALNSLMTLDLSDNKITDLSPLAGLTSLTDLSLRDNEIVDVAPLADLTSLTSLGLSHNKITDVSPLAALNSLMTLSLSDNKITDVSPLAGLTALSWLELYDNELADVSPLAGLTSLTSLYLSDNELGDVAPLAGLTSLTSLSLDGNKIADVAPLADLTTLWSLDLSDNAISDLPPLAGLTSLAVLGLSSNKMTDVSPLADLTTLWSLDLSDNAISDLPPLSGLTSLVVLALLNNAISDVAPLSGLVSLRDLRLDGNAVSDVSPLGDLGRLSFLALGDNAVVDISPLLESGLPGVENYVDLRGNPLGEGQADHVLTLRESGAVVEYDDGGHRVPLFPSAARSAAMAGSSAMGFARVINHSDEAGSVSIEAVDETGERRGPVCLAIGAGQALHFNARDLEQGSAAKGLREIGEGSGDWRLVLRSELDVEVLGYARTPDGFVTSLHDLAPEDHSANLRLVRAGARRVVPTFNPGSNRRQTSRLRLTNPTASERRASVVAWDDDALSPQPGALVLVTPAHGTLDLTAAQLESGREAGEDGAGFAGIGDGDGKWRLTVRAPGQRVMSLLQSPTGHLTNISTGTAVLRNERGYHSWERGGRYRVPLFLAASSNVQGFLRIVSLHTESAAVTLRAYDGAGVAGEPAVLTLEGYHVLHLNSDDLESGNAAKGLPGIGTGVGDWHLEVSADRRFEVLAYARTADGFVTSLHDIAPRLEDGSLWIPFFNPASNRVQASRLRLVNWGETAAEATITGIDDAGESPGGAVRAMVPARSARDYMAWELETGDGAELSGALGDGAGKWRLRVSAPGEVEAMSLLRLPTGHVTNLSTTPRHPRQYGRSAAE